MFFIIFQVRKKLYVVSRAKPNGPTRESLPKTPSFHPAGESMATDHSQPPLSSFLSPVHYEHFR